MPFSLLLTPGCDRTYTMLAKPNAKAMWSRGRVLSHGECANQVKANMAMQAAAEGA